MTQMVQLKVENSVQTIFWHLPSYIEVTEPPRYVKVSSSTTHIDLGEVR